MVKSQEKLRSQMLKRGWTAAQIEEAVAHGRRHAARNAATGGPATRYIHPTTGRSVVIDDATGEVIHVGGDGFQY
ncbi:colicin E5-related ribonuclease [Salinarimonas soli]|uniref:colicin E5-related ribonuclease n=1 Tax=Salinarimonas soli TaxID=1638099 RepID=UPI001661C6A8|nr:colicin E5-related ribonuclease [Salinarimonas soli]